MKTDDLPDTERGHKKWFTKTHTKRITTLITKQEFSQGIKRWKERTRTSPSPAEQSLQIPHALSSNVSSHSAFWSNLFANMTHRSKF